MTRLSDLSAGELNELVAGLGSQRFRARQIREWALARGVFDPRAMTNLPIALRETLASALSTPPIVAEDAVSSGDGTAKLLFKLADGRRVEAVMIPGGKRTTICLSSQVGCAVRCSFCASGIGGGQRNLSSGEIVEQYLAMKQLADDRGRSVTNVVMMGMGEPMFNYANVMRALDDLREPDGPGLGARRITVSTVGIREGVEKFTEAHTQYTLAFSLHAPNDELRRRLVPLEAAMTVDEIFVAARRYLETTGREVTFEYVLLRGINDSEECGDELARRLRGVRGHLNVIPYNPVPEFDFQRPDDRQIERFAARLEGAGCRITVRQRKGADIAAACGQLAFEKTIRD